MSVIVPQADHWLLQPVVLVAEDADRRGIQQEKARRVRGQPQPASRQHPENMSVSKDKHVPWFLPRSRDDSIRPLTDLLRGLSSGTAIAKQVPPGRLLVD